MSSQSVFRALKHIKLPALHINLYDSGDKPKLRNFCIERSHLHDFDLGTSDWCQTTISNHLIFTKVQRCFPILTPTAHWSHNRPITRTIPLQVIDQVLSSKLNWFVSNNATVRG
jgi:hypothetical protein